MSSANQKYDAVIIGSGPNGLAAGIRLSLEGLRVKIIEAEKTVGGGMRTKELMSDGCKHDICSAIHPMAASSPFLKKLPLEAHGLEWIHPDFAAAHPLDCGEAALLSRDLFETAFLLNQDENRYRSIVEPIVDHWDGLTKDFLGPLSIPRNPLAMASFGLKGLLPASIFQKYFKTVKSKALFAGMAAHSILPLNLPATTAIGLVFYAAAHTGGWPLPKGGSQMIANAMTSYFELLGGEIETGHRIKNLNQLPESKAVLFDLTPLQVARIAGDKLPPSYRRKLEGFTYGSGVFKVDYILKEPVPWSDPNCAKAGTVHLGGTFEEIAASEKEISEGVHSENPFVLVAQQSLFDDSRTPDDRHTLWAYCHVPNGSKRDMTNQIEDQIERFAPGFRDVIDSKVTMNTADFETYNENYVGGDINGGRQDISQLFSRPVSLINPYKIPSQGLYFCSSSTPPGGGVHGMCGYHAANAVLKHEFEKTKSDWAFSI
ncbi:phytoene desaturase family protein [Rhodohalobacter halophilus]|uniref:phytoene desaturase family protein n=1 Tax=Rhodohalobacter halophilus TaxID=1812810 RepID=UPI00083F7469|nr:NAD(P)/FAD-dependent oxidoreductase [Rhodohalobacter halophilus]